MPVMTIEKREGFTTKKLRLEEVKEELGVCKSTVLRYVSKGYIDKHTVTTRNVFYSISPTLLEIIT